MMEKSVWRTSGHGSSLGGERGRKSSEFSSLGKTKRGFASLYRTHSLDLDIKMFLKLYYSYLRARTGLARATFTV